MKINKRICAALFVAATVFVVVCSALFVIHGIGHDCIGEGCAVCNSFNILRKLQSMLLLASVLTVCAHADRSMQAMCPGTSRCMYSWNTPIELKVKLLN